MAPKKDLGNIHIHGVEIDPRKQRVRCKYCSKEMTGFHRLKLHLGHIKGTVVFCSEVPQEVNEVLRRDWSEFILQKDKKDKEKHPKSHSRKRKLDNAGPSEENPSRG